MALVGEFGPRELGLVGVWAGRWTCFGERHPQARVFVLPGEEDHVRAQGHESDQGSVTAGLPFLLLTKGG